MKLSVPRRLSRLKSGAVGIAIAAVMSLATVTAIAVEDKTSAASTTAECVAFKGAAESAMRNQLTVVNAFMDGANTQMQRAVSKGNSCIGNLALLDFDLSKLIPDFGLLGTLLQAAITKIVDGVINKACNALIDIVSKPGDLWNSILGTININDQFQNWGNGISYKLPGGGGGGGGDVITPPIVITPPPRKCFETVAGVICTDGGTTPGKDPDKDPSGVDIGKRAAELMDSCKQALDNDVRNLSAGQFTNAGNAVCATYQQYIFDYYRYLTPEALLSFNAYPISFPTGRQLTQIRIDGWVPYDDLSPPPGRTTKSAPQQAATPSGSYSLPVRE